MATHKSAEKRARQSVRRNKVNRARRSHILNHTKALEAALTGKDEAVALQALRKAEGALARGAGNGVLHWKTAARKTSRLAKRVKAMKTAPAATKAKK